MVTRHNTVKQCHIENEIITWLMFFGILFSEIILMIRTYAIWDRRRSILITFCGFGLFIFIPGIILVQYAMASLEYIEVPSNITACVASHVKSEFVGAAFILLVFTETVTVILTMTKAVQHLRHSRSTWVSKMYTDGLLFYIYTLGLSLTNVVVILSSKTSAGWLYPLQSVFHSIFCSRVLLLILRQHAHLHSDSLESTSLCYSNPTSVHPETDPS